MLAEAPVTTYTDDKVRGGFAVSEGGVAAALP